MRIVGNSSEKPMIPKVQPTEAEMPFHDYTREESNRGKREKSTTFEEVLKKKEEDAKRALRIAELEVELMRSFQGSDWKGRWSRDSFSEEWKVE